MSLKIAGAAAALVFAAVQVVPQPAAGDSGDDLVKAVIGLTAIAIIANEVKKGKQAKAAAARAAAEAAEKDAEKRKAPPICRTPYRDGGNWRNDDGRICLPTPEVCMRETSRPGRSFVTFEYECMWSEGFRLSRRY